MEPYCFTMRHHLINTNCLSDGVQEVAYIHSNQTVIGSSKAENHMSRWAARDVFELKQFSQLPANVAVCTSKVREHRILTSLVFRSHSIGSSLNTPSKAATKTISAVQTSIKNRMPFGALLSLRMSYIKRQICI